MNKKRIIVFLALVFLMGGNLHGQTGQTDLCIQVDMKPILSLQQLSQAELIDILVVLSGLQRPDPEGMTPEQMYDLEVQMLIDAGYPPVFAEIEPDRLVTRRYFASTMYQVALDQDANFAAKHSGLTDETEQMKALVEEDYLYAEEGRVYREEILSILCNKLKPPPIVPAYDIIPEKIMEATIEYPVSPI